MHRSNATFPKGFWVDDTPKQCGVLEMRLPIMLCSFHQDASPAGFRTRLFLSGFVALEYVSHGLVGP